jgi:hypothetical protein
VSTDAKPDQQSPAPAGDRHQRSAKNLLIDRRFQLKYTYLIILLTVLISVPLGFLLYQEASTAVQLGSEANVAATEAVAQAKLLNTKLAFDAKIAAKGDDARVAQATRENEAATADIAERAKKLEAQQVALKGQQMAIIWTLVAALTLLVVLVGLLGVAFTHKVAGPIHRMRGLFKEVGDGVFTPYVALRKGDDLQDFFTEFTQMVQKLRERQKLELERLDLAIKRAEESGAGPDSVTDLRRAREAMRTAIAKSMPPPPNR